MDEHTLRRIFREELRDLRADDDGCLSMEHLPRAVGNPLDLGGLISALGKVGKDRDGRSPTVMFRFGSAYPGKFTSYRGYYELLALTYDGNRCDVDGLLSACRETVGKEFEGYKGGRYTMGLSTEIYVANWGLTSSTRIVGVSWQKDSYIAYLETAEFDDA